jgi:hypothetical protein
MNWAEQLEKLQQLHQQGALTDEEYTTAKARVIRDLGPGPAPAAQAARAAIEQSQSAMQQLKRSLTDRWLGGVAGGGVVGGDAQRSGRGWGCGAASHHPHLLARRRVTVPCPVPLALPIAEAVLLQRL